MSSPTAVTTSSRVTAVLPKAAKSHFGILLKLASEKGTIDGAAVLAITEMLADREFALSFKTKLSEENEADKLKRTEAREARLQKAADKAGVTLDEHKANLAEAKSRSNSIDTPPASPKAASAPSSPVAGLTSMADVVQAVMADDKSKKKAGGAKKEKKEKKEKKKKAVTPPDSSDEE